MPKRAWVPLLLAAGLLVGGTVVALSMPYSLAGSVVDAETGQPVAGAAVTLGRSSAETSADGAFALTGAGGFPLMHVEAPGYRPAGSVWLLGMFAAPQHGPLRLQPVVLRGRVIDADSHAPIAGATVAAGSQTAQTDAQGSYALKRVCPGDAIRVQARGYREVGAVRYQGQAAQDLALALLPATVVLRDACNGRPLAGAEVRAGGASLTSDAQGMATLARLAAPAQVVVACAGYGSAQGLAAPGETLELALRPAPLYGGVHTRDGQPLADALVLARSPGLQPSLARTNASGEFELDCVPAGTSLTVRLAGYRTDTRQVGAARTLAVELEPFVAKGIYLPVDLLNPALSARLRADLDLVDRTELNAVVIEMKTQDGHVAFAPALPLARESGAGLGGLVDVRGVLAECRQRDIYTIARLPVFEDDVLATARPEWAVHRTSGAVWRADGGCGWLDPFRHEVWDYNIALAKEVAALGFDEIQFDYVRFPTDGATDDCRFAQESTPASRAAAIAGFLAAARTALDEAGVFFSADFFGLTTFAEDEAGIGQMLDQVGPYLDYVSPMVYPSTYGSGMLGIGDPWRSPYDVVKLSLLAAHRKTGTAIRPWLQHFDDYHGLGIGYGPREVRLQVQAALEGQSAGWLFWNPGGEYDPASFAAQ